jgi:hypothetical protein
MSTENERVDELTRAAARARARLEKDLDELNQRGHRLVNTAKTIAKPPTSVILAAAIGVAATALILQQLRSRRRRPKLRKPTKARPDRSSLRLGLQSVATALLSLLVKRLGTRGIDRWLSQARTPSAAATAAPAGVETHRILPVLAAK